MSEHPSTSQAGPGQDHNLPVLSVSEISGLLKRAVEAGFSRVRVRGEISGFKRAASGHLYFTLKDADAVLDGVCWRGTAGRLGLEPEDGIEVVATGRLTTYAQRSRYQIVVEAMEMAGEGALLKLLEERRRKLAEEGLFDPDRKQELPYLPDVIGVVTSPTGAVIRDILHRLANRFPRRVLLWPVAVQGAVAAEEIAAAIKGFNRLKPGAKVPRPDLLIVARGGGSLEDLWAFNEEIVVRAAAKSRIPLISAVGHETDVTLIDFAADARAPTPTAAAEMAVPVRAELVAAVEEEGARLVAAAARLIEDRKVRLDGLARGLPDLGRLAGELAQRLDEWTERLKNALDVGMSGRKAALQRWAAEIPSPKQQIVHARNQLDGAARALVTAARTLARERGQALRQAARLMESASYERVLERGFALVADEANRPVVSAAGLAPGMGVGLRFHDGEARATVESVAGPGRPGAPKSKPRKRKPPPTDGGQGGGPGDDQGRLL